MHKTHPLQQKSFSPLRMRALTTDAAFLNMVAPPLGLPGIEGALSLDAWRTSCSMAALMMPRPDGEGCPNRAAVVQVGC